MLIRASPYLSHLCYSMCRCTSGTQAANLAPPLRTLRQPMQKGQAGAACLRAEMVKVRCSSSSCGRVGGVSVPEGRDGKGERCSSAPRALSLVPHPPLRAPVSMLLVYIVCV